MTLKFNIKILKVVIKLSATIHELSCQQAFLPYLAMVENPKIRSSDLTSDL